MNPVQVDVVDVPSANPGQVDLVDTLPERTSVMEVKCLGDRSCLYHGVAFGLSQILQREGWEGQQGTMTGLELREMLANLLTESLDLRIRGDHVAQYINNDGRTSDVSSYADGIRSGIWGGGLEVIYHSVNYSFFQSLTNFTALDLDCEAV